MSNITIILTSTINVKQNISCMYQTNRDDRKSIYLKSILQWLQHTNFKIVLVENSGDNFEELAIEKIKYKDRFEIFTFIENELEHANYLQNTLSKGASEIFAINYAMYFSKLIKQTDFIIKITARYFIPELENYLSKIDLHNYECLSQYDPNRCEMVGCNYKNFSYIFNINLTNNKGEYTGHVESMYKERISTFNNILRCETFIIEPTLRGGHDASFSDI